MAEQTEPDLDSVIERLLEGTFHPQPLLPFLPPIFLFLERQILIFFSVQFEEIDLENKFN